MTNYDNTNKGAMWKKQANNGTNYLGGKINVEGVEYWISVFKNEYKDSENKPDYKITLKPVEEKAEQKANIQEEDF